MFREVLQQRPNAHPLHSDALRDLGFALGIKYMHTGDAKLCMESMQLLCAGTIYDTGIVSSDIIALQIQTIWQKDTDDENIWQDISLALEEIQIGDQKMLQFSCPPRQEFLSNF